MGLVGLRRLVSLSMQEGITCKERNRKLQRHISDQVLLAPSMHLDELEHAPFQTDIHCFYDDLKANELR